MRDLGEAEDHDQPALLHLLGAMNFTSFREMLIHVNFIGSEGRKMLALHIAQDCTGRFRHLCLTSGPLNPLAVLYRRNAGNVLNDETVCARLRAPRESEPPAPGGRSTYSRRKVRDKLPCGGRFEASYLVTGFLTLF